MLGGCLGLRCEADFLFGGAALVVVVLNVLAQLRKGVRVWMGQEVHGQVAMAHAARSVNLGANGKNHILQGDAAGDFFAEQGGQGGPGFRIDGCQALANPVAVQAN